MVPPSPACGFRPATTICGLVIPKSRVRAAAVIVTISMIASSVTGGDGITQSYMNAKRNNPQGAHRQASLRRARRRRRVPPDIRYGRYAGSRPVSGSACESDWLTTAAAAPMVTSLTASSMAEITAGALAGSGVPGMGRLLSGRERTGSAVPKCAIASSGVGMVESWTGPIEFCRQRGEAIDIVNQEKWRHVWIVHAPARPSGQLRHRCPRAPPVVRARGRGCTMLSPKVDIGGAPQIP